MSHKISRAILNETGGLLYAYMPYFDNTSFKYGTKKYVVTNYQEWKCSVCKKQILNNINQKTMPKTKCADCIKEAKRLREKERYQKHKKELVING